ncbi:PP_RS20740 family protein [Microbacterium sp. 22179]|uniref:PP_RS20740 family protein n=1 Tax=Microbacterium sp. 22179 TaxID=3453886 RepID=UPI003F835866
MVFSNSFPRRSRRTFSVQFLEFWKPRTLSDHQEHEGSGEDLRSLIGDGSPPFPARTERSFQPWHRPRKQHVRSAQWSRELGILIRDLQITEEVRYLTLPGNDFLDIRHFAKSVCGPRNVRLKYLGFNTAASPLDAGQPELNATQFSINRLDVVDSESEVVDGDFRRVGNTRSIQWRKVRKAGPFHVINLDLCGGFAGKERAGGIPNYFAALQAVLQNQSSSDEDFLLFITTRIDEESIEANVRQSLQELSQAMHDACQSYASEFASAWGIHDAADSVALSDEVSVADGFMLGLTQWIVSQAVGHGMRAAVRSFFTYRTGADMNGEDDIVSLAIRFKPDPFIHVDAQGLVGSLSTPAERDDKLCEQSSRIPKRVRQRVLVDDILSTQADVFQQCFLESSELLQDAGYEAEAYRDWVMQEADRYATA